MKINDSAIVPPLHAKMRLDKSLSILFPAYSRARLKKWLLAGEILVDAKQMEPSDKLKGGEEITINVYYSESSDWQAEAVPLDIVFEDEHLLIINKCANLVVHPAAGNHSGTLVNGLLHYLPANGELPRAGIVHRLDKDTTGLLIIAKTLECHTKLVAMLQERTIERRYAAIVLGEIIARGTVDKPMGRSPRDRLKMAVVSGGRTAVTHYRVEEKFKAYTLLDVSLETGRTHQIRVHMAFIKHPIVGDKVYGGRPRLPKYASKQLISSLQGFTRQALHARELRFIHPMTDDNMHFVAGLPDDMQALLQVLRDED